LDVKLGSNRSIYANTYLSKFVNSRLKNSVSQSGFRGHLTSEFGISFY